MATGMVFWVFLAAITAFTVHQRWEEVKYHRRDLIYRRARKARKKNQKQIILLMKQYQKGIIGPTKLGELIRLLRQDLKYYFQQLNYSPNLACDGYVSQQMRLIRDLEKELPEKTH